MEVALRLSVAMWLNWGSLANIKFGKRVIIYDGGVTRPGIKVSILYQEFLRLMPLIILAALCLQLAGRLVLSTIQDSLFYQCSKKKIDLTTSLAAF